MSKELDAFLADPNNTIVTWMGKNIEDCTREELISIIKQQGRMAEQQAHTLRDRTAFYSDLIKIRREAGKSWLDKVLEK